MLSVSWVSGCQRAQGLATRLTWVSLLGLTFWGLSSSLAEDGALQMCCPAAPYLRDHTGRVLGFLSPSPSIREAAPWPTGRAAFLLGLNLSGASLASRFLPVWRWPAARGQGQGSISPQPRVGGLCPRVPAASWEPPGHALVACSPLFPALMPITLWCLTGGRNPLIQGPLDMARSCSGHL